MIEFEWNKDRLGEYLKGSEEAQQFLRDLVKVPLENRQRIKQEILSGLVPTQGKREFFSFGYHLMGFSEEELDGLLDEIPEEKFDPEKVDVFIDTEDQLIGYHTDVEVHYRGQMVMHFSLSPGVTPQDISSSLLYLSRSMETGDMRIDGENGIFFFDTLRVASARVPGLEGDQDSPGK